MVKVAAGISPRGFATQLVLHDNKKTEVAYASVRLLTNKISQRAISMDVFQWTQDSGAL